MRIDISDIRAFWDANPCQSALSEQEDRKKYFEEITRKRFGGREWHVPIIAKFDKFRDKEVLEVGCGIGTDGFEFAKCGAKYTGIDLTTNSVKLAKERFELFNLRGRFRVVNAEEGLPFEDNSFDHIYSFGVIHHSPNAEAIVSEMYRVLKPGGTITVMLYNRSSINYYMEIMFLRKILKWILYPRFMPILVSKITGFAEWKLKGHREIMIRRGKMTKQEWINMNTDGPYCPLARVYNKKEAVGLFEKFADLRQEIWEFNTDHWPFLGSLIPHRIEVAIGRLWGWHRVIYGTKKWEKAHR